MPSKEILLELLKKTIGDRLHKLEIKVSSELSDLRFIKTSYDGFNKKLEDIEKLRKDKIKKDEQLRLQKEQETQRKREKSLGPISRGKSKPRMQDKTEKKKFLPSKTINNLTKNTEHSKGKSLGRNRKSLGKDKIPKLNITSSNLNTSRISEAPAKSRNKSNIKSRPSERTGRNTVNTTTVSRLRTSKSQAPPKKKDFLKKKDNLQNILNTVEIKPPSDRSQKTEPVEIPKATFKLIVEKGIFEKHIKNYLDCNDIINFSLTQKKFLFYLVDNLKLKQDNLKLIFGISPGETIEDKLNDLNNKYKNEELDAPAGKFELSRACAKALGMLDQEIYMKIFNKPMPKDQLKEVVIIYRLYCQLLKKNDLLDIKDDNEFFEKFQNYVKENKGEKLGQYFINTCENFQSDDNNILKLKLIVGGDKKEKLKMGYFGNICGTTAFFAFLIKDYLEFIGVIIDKKTPPYRIKSNLNFEKTVYDRLVQFIKKINEIILTK